MEWMNRPTSAVACVNSCVVWMEWPRLGQFGLVVSQTVDLMGADAVGSAGSSVWWIGLGLVGAR